MPALGVAQQTGTLLKWLKVEGQSVTKGEPLMEIETDKATVEIEAPSSGVLTRVIAKAGDEIPVGQRIAFILAPGESLPTEAAPAGLARPTTLGKANAAKSAVTTPSTLDSAEARVGRVLASPAAKRIAHEKGVDLATLKGSGPQGSILAEDVMRAADSTAAATATSKTDRIVPLSAVRRITGERMTQSKRSTPHFYLSVDIDMSAVANLRSGWDQSGESDAPSINDFTLYACARALKDFPAVNSSFVDQKIQLHADINVGMAVAIDDGLVVPVIRNADRLSLTELAAQSRLRIDKAQKKKLLPLDYEGGTFTVSNLGMLGVDSFIAIINPPQCAILAVGRVAPRVVVEDGMFAIKSLMSATLSADHRVIDGAIGARFLQQVKHYLEQGMS